MFDAVAEGQAPVFWPGVGEDREDRLRVSREHREAQAWVIVRLEVERDRLRGALEELRESISDTRVTGPAARIHRLGEACKAADAALAGSVSDKDRERRYPAWQQASPYQLPDPGPDRVWVRNDQLPEPRPNDGPARLYLVNRLTPVLARPEEPVPYDR